MEKSCKRCGAPVSDDWVSCPSCGIKLIVEASDMVKIILTILSILSSMGAMYLFWLMI